MSLALGPPRKVANKLTTLFRRKPVLVVSNALLVWGAESQWPMETLSQTMPHDSNDHGLRDLQ